jgi:hypothetical protein
MCVFDDIDRELEGGARHLISHFDYLNNSDRVEAERVREIIDDFISRYPANGRQELRRRLRSVDDITHISAFFELALNELLLRAGCTIIALEPEIVGTAKSPDFLVETAVGDRFYLEATLATGRSQAGAAAQRRLDEALSTIDEVTAHDFFFSLSHSGFPTAPITLRSLRSQLQRWIDDLSYDDVLAREASQRALPVFRYDEHGLRIRISPVPRRRSRGRTPGRAIAARMLNGLTVEPQVPIRNAIRGKATRYGDLNLPYVIAVNAMGDYAHEDHAIDALFGTPAVAVRRTDSGFEDRPVLVPDGVWRGRGGPTNTRISAVLSTEKLTPWSLGQKQARLICNPWAQRPLPDLGLGLDLYTRDRERQPGRTLGAIFGLADDWPEAGA